MKKKLLIGMLAVLLVPCMTGCGKETKKETKQNKEQELNENITKEKEVEGIKITKTSLVYKDGMSKLTSTVTNTTNEDKEVKSFNIDVKGETGYTVITLLGYVGATLKPNESRVIESNVSMDLTTAIDITYTLNK